MKIDVHGWRWDLTADEQDREVCNHRSVAAKHYMIVKDGNWYVLRGGEIASAVHFVDRFDAMVAAMMMEYSLLGHSEYVNSYGYPEWMGYVGSEI